MSVIKSSRPVPQANVLDKPIPQNPKYKNIQSTIDTGDSITKFLKRSEELKGSSKQQPNEIFKRMKISTLVKLITQVAEISSLENAAHGSSLSNRTFSSTDRPETQDSQMSMASARSTLDNVVHGMGEVDVYKKYIKQNSTIPTTPATPKTANSQLTNFDYEERPYLLVDLRDIDEFNKNHIVSAHHYPAAMLSRCSNNESKELLLYKNHKGKIIVLYDEDEHLAPRSATIMTERGYNNIFVLTGGIRYAVRKFPRGLITGTCPLSWTTADIPPKPTKIHDCSQSMDISHHEVPLNHFAMHSARSLPSAMATFDSREQFTSEDIEALNEQHEAHLLPRDSGTRLSRAQTQASKQSSRISNISERSNISNISDKPWKP
ncbi:unnamed protein product [Adineta steineri]|uniref:Rhodanese domain-containing protein n=1 Tax=Adineta steineri TaxID=433720 RepID=A0A814KS13_9BILA|nr:unnamed protein product [Adineta steineri]